VLSRLRNTTYYVAVRLARAILSRFELELTQAGAQGRFRIRLRNTRSRLKETRSKLKGTRSRLEEDRSKLKEEREELVRQRSEVKHLKGEVKHLKALDDFYAFAIKYHAVGAKTGGTYKDTYWLGARALKLPLDLWVYQEILYETRPDLIIETGTAFGGSALYLASVCDLLGTGRVLSIDLSEAGHIKYPSSEERPRHPRIRYLHGSSTNPAIVDEVKREAKNAQRTMVVLDSDHSEQHVYAELKAYAPLVSIGGYLVVEDTHVGGDWGKPFGPGKAVQTFLEEDSRFEVDPAREKFLITFNHNGYLKRVR
jgi:cephalosporin hydroxylase